MECLSMPARMFFRMLKEGRDIKQSEKYGMLHELCDVSVCGNSGVDSKFIDALKKFYREKVEIAEGVKAMPVSSGRVLDSANPNTALLLFDLAKQKMRVEGYH